ncbi:MAG: methyl-accepting chemotaxis protein, partial [Actinobacteria bacterium]|nr:methyl-accepting chemotaxis protein [Actinomycetota bacterium]
TAKATDDISGKIAAIQSDTGGAVEAIRRIGAIIAQISGIQNTIAAAVEEQTATTNEIARNVSDAARGSAEIAENIGSVADTARTTSEGAAAIQDAAAGLADVADELQSLVGIIHGHHPSPMIAAFDAGEQGRSVTVREPEHVG